MIKIILYVNEIGIIYTTCFYVYDAVDATNNLLIYNKINMHCDDI